VPRPADLARRRARIDDDPAATTRRPVTTTPVSDHLGELKAADRRQRIITAYALAWWHAQ
jgi:hypothetical protein